MRPLDSILVATALAVATLSVAPVASGSEAILWGCHGPVGQPLGTGGFQMLAALDGATRTFGGGCAGQQADGGLTSTFNRPDPAGGSIGAWQLDIPAGATLTALRVDRQTAGFGGGIQDSDPMRYFTSTPLGLVEAARLDDASNVPLNGSLTAAAGGQSVRVGVDCTLAPGDRCAAPTGGLMAVNFGAIAATVQDDDAPKGALGGVTNPAAGMLKLALRATDSGVGLETASATIDHLAPISLPLGGDSCAELSPSDATADLPAGASCPASVDDAELDFDTTAIPDGTHHLKYVITDAAGNATTLVDQDFTVKNTPAPQHATATLNLGSGGVTDGGQGSGTGTQTGGAGGSKKGCLKPKLSARLTTKHVRYSHGVPVLVANRHYSFKGRLTCLVAGHRHSAPRLTKVEVINIVAGRWHKKRRTLVRRRLGAVTFIHGYASSRTLEFRYRSADKTNTHVRIKLAVVAKGRP